MFSGYMGRFVSVMLGFVAAARIGARIDRSD